MNSKKLIALSVLVMMLGLIGCQKPVEQASVIGMANPASEYCEEHGGALDIRKDTKGNEYGVCVFEDGSECEEWAFYKGECGPGTTDEDATEVDESEVAPGMANPASVYCEENGGTLDIRKRDDGGENGVCIFADGSICEEWDFYRGDCKSEEIIVGESVVYWSGVIKANPEGAQFDDYFETPDGEIYGLGSRVEGLEEQIEALRDSDTTIRLCGTLITDANDVNGRHIAVTLIETK